MKIHKKINKQNQNQNMATSELTLGYWAGRGRGGVLRSLLAYVRLPYTNKQYADFNEWFGKDKHSLGIDYPNLPYIIDGDRKITETNALIYHIPIRAGRKDLIGDTDDKFIQVQVALNVRNDLYQSLSSLCYGQGDFQADKVKAFGKGRVKSKLEVFNKNFEGKEFLTGFLSVADFNLFECVDLVNQMDAKELEPYPNLIRFHQRFRDMPEIKAFLSSDNHNKVWYPPGSKWSQ